MPLLWPKASTTVIYKIVENFCGLASPIKPTYNYISEQYVNVWEDHRINTKKMTKCYIYSLVSWLCDKSDEINVNFSSENKTIENDNKFQGNDFTLLNKKCKI